VFDADSEKNNIIVFYEPLYYDDEILGVVIGNYKEKQMQEFLYNTFFNNDSRVFLCTGDGRLVASSNGDYKTTTIYQKENFNEGMSDETEEELKKALLSGSDYEFQYIGSKGVANGYLTPLSVDNLFLVQTFPSEVTTKLIADANKAGMLLLGELVAIFIICLIVVLVTNSMQKKRLLLENKEKSYVVDGIMQLFELFVLVDLENNTYKYIVGTKPREDFPMEGKYDDLAEFATAGICDEDEKAHFLEMLSADMLRRNMDEDTDDLRYEYKCRTNENRWDSINIICLNRVEGRPALLLFTCQDVTKAKEREQQGYEALKEAYRALENANQAKTRFLNNMSHDIRTPMNAIIGFTALASTHIEKTEMVKDYLSKIMTSSNHLLSLINDVLDMSRIESGKVTIEEKECSLPEIMHDLKNILQADIHSKQLEFLIDTVDVTDENVICDKLRLNQILLNCLSNAMKFTRPGGTISVRIIQKAGAPDGRASFEFKIRDTGIGMSKEFVKHIFEPFERERTSTVSGIQGTGLGMAITKNIVDMMNGTIEVESEEGKGTEFTIALQFKLTGKHNKIEAIPELQGLRALVVDDDFNTCTSVAQMLTNIGLRADWTTLGKEAVLRATFATENNDEYHVYIIDWLMPDMNGIECVRRIRKALGDSVPIIILTAYDWSDIEEEAKAAGVTAFCSKPLFLSELRDTLLSAGGYLRKNEKAEEEFDSTSFEGKRVLLVEDVELNREIAEVLLTEAGFAVDCALDGKEAVERVERSTENYDLILMDIQMPVMDGYEASRQIRKLEDKSKASIPILALTANAFEEDRKAALEAGMNGHLTKPIRINDLYNAIKKYLK
jgi:signal transduction histidine kinase/DNA-binding response OmpR family regulator